MTESKSNIHPLSIEGGESDFLDALGTQAKDFLTNTRNRKFMTEFEVGANKLKFWGLPITMAQKSGVIESIIFKDPPYVLMVFGVVYEKPMTLVWLGLNDQVDWESGDFDEVLTNHLNLEEYLQIGRIANYLNLKRSAFTITYEIALGPILRKINLDFSNFESNKKIVIQRKDQIVKMVNSMIQEIRPGGRSKGYIDEVVEIVDIIYKIFPEIVDKITDIPIYDQDNVIRGLVVKNYPNISELNDYRHARLIKIEPNSVRITYGLTTLIQTGRYPGGAPPPKYYFVPQIEGSVESIM